jgi:hypothetical protein
MSEFVTVKYGGITAYCDAYIDTRIAPNEPHRLCYASFFGDAEQTKALVAGLIGGHDIEIFSAGADYGQTFYRHQRTMTFKSIQLEQGIQIVVYCPELMDLSAPYASKVVIGNDCYDKIFRLIMKLRTTPLLPEWKERILDEMKITGLRCFGFPCVRMVELISDDALETYVQEHVKELATPKRRYA